VEFFQFFSWICVTICPLQGGSNKKIVKKLIPPSAPSITLTLCHQVQCAWQPCVWEYTLHKWINTRTAINTHIYTLQPVYYSTTYFMYLLNTTWTLNVIRTNNIPTYATWIFSWFFYLSWANLTSHYLCLRIIILRPLTSKLSFNFTIINIRNLFSDSTTSITSSAYKSRQGKRCLKLLDNASITVMNSKSITTNPLCTPSLTWTPC